MPTYCSPIKTAEMLATLTTIPIPYELILVDDNSDVETLRMLREYVEQHRDAQLHENKVNRGFATNCNIGARLASGNVLLFLNNDLLLQPGWFEPMWTAVDLSDDIGVIGNVQYSINTGRIDHAGMFFHCDGLPRQARKGCLYPPVEDFHEWRCVSAACIMIRRKVFWEVDGFDEDYRNGCEDADLCVRLHLAGYRHLVCNRSVVQHHVSSSPGRFRHNDANLVLFCERWADVTKAWGGDEWAAEYWAIYRNKPWKIEPRLWWPLFKELVLK